jgi:hypothetical protein
MFCPPTVIDERMVWFADPVPVATVIQFPVIAASDPPEKLSALKAVAVELYENSSFSIVVVDEFVTTSELPGVLAVIERTTFVGVASTVSVTPVPITRSSSASYPPAAPEFAPNAARVVELEIVLVAIAHLKSTLQNICSPRRPRSPSSPSPHPRS